MWKGEELWHLVILKDLLRTDVPYSCIISFQGVGTRGGASPCRTLCTSSPTPQPLSPGIHLKKLSNDLPAGLEPAINSLKLRRDFIFLYVLGIYLSLLCYSVSVHTTDLFYQYSPLTFTVIVDVGVWRCEQIPQEAITPFFHVVAFCLFLFRFFCLFQRMFMSRNYLPKGSVCLSVSCA